MINRETSGVSSDPHEFLQNFQFTSFPENFRSFFNTLLFRTDIHFRETIVLIGGGTSGVSSDPYAFLQNFVYFTLFVENFRSSFNALFFKTNIDFGKTISTKFPVYFYIEKFRSSFNTLLFKTNVSFGETILSIGTSWVPSDPYTFPENVQFVLVIGHKISMRF